MNSLSPKKIRPEIIVIDDNSPDRTAEAAQALAKHYPIQVIKRIRQRGLGSAIIDGIHAAQAQIICVMDADLSHPPEAIPEMFKIIQDGKAELVIGSRRAAGGGTSEWIWYRKFIHWIARVLGSFLTPIKDITSGFFMFDKKIIENVNLEPKSWKIGLEIMVKGKYDKAVEYPIVFVEREAGKSKMRFAESIAYFFHVVSLALYKMKK